MIRKSAQISLKFPENLKPWSINYRTIFFPGISSLKSLSPTLKCKPSGSNYLPVVIKILFLE